MTNVRAHLETKLANERGTLEASMGTRGLYFSEALGLAMARAGTAQKMVDAMIEQANSGNVAAFRELWDRLEGPVVKKVDAQVTQSRYVIEEVGVLDVEHEIGGGGADPDRGITTPLIRAAQTAERIPVRPPPELLGEPEELSEKSLRDKA